MQSDLVHLYVDTDASVVHCDRRYAEIVRIYFLRTYLSLYARFSALAAGLTNPAAFFS